MELYLPGNTIYASSSVTYLKWKKHEMINKLSVTLETQLPEPEYGLC